mgnify:CR=1 FL=1
MPRKQMRNEDSSISLFPFLDALSGVIGILALIIAALAAVNAQTADQTISYDADSTNVPLYLECKEGGVVVHPEKKFVALEDIQNATSAWRDILQSVGPAKERKSVLLLVRPAGIDAFAAAEIQVKQNSLPYYYDAVATDGEIIIQPVKQKARHATSD